jgi:predicted acetyltransferase
LAVRRYLGDDAITVAVNDPILQNNSATFAITGHGAEPTNQHPQLQVDIEGLGAALLGGTTWRSLAVAGLACADDAATLDAADRLFAVPEAPFAGFYF